MLSVEGEYAPRIDQSVPSSFGGGNTDLASAFEGALKDFKAVQQQTIRTLEDVGVMAQRVSSMLGGTVAGNGFEPLSSVHAIGNAMMGLSYGSGMGAGPNYGFGLGTMPVGVGNPAMGNFNNNNSFEPMSSPMPSGPGVDPEGYSPATPEDTQEATNASVRRFLEMAAGEKYLSNTGATDIRKGLSTGKNLSVSSIGQRVAGVVANKFPNWTSPTKMTAFEDLAPADQAALAAGPADQLALAKAVGVESEGAGLGAGVGTLAETGDFAAAGGATLGGLAGPVGIGIGAVGMGLHELESQRATNAAIQAQVGGSNFSAFGTRLQGLGFALSNLGDMGMGQSRQAFSGVTDLGLQGGNRASALDFIMSNYNNLGMSVSDSMEVLSDSVKSGRTNLQALAATLDDVTNSAQAAQVNTEVARQSFTNMYQGAISAGVSTSGAGILAAANTNVASTLGLSGQSTRFGQAPNAQAAAALGMNLGEYNANIAEGGFAGASAAARGQQAAMTQILGHYAGMIPNGTSLAAAAYSHLSGGQSQFAQTMMRNNVIVNPQTQLPQLLQTAGINTSGMDLDAMWNAFAGVSSGHINLSRAVNNAQASQTVNKALNARTPKQMGLLGQVLAIGPGNLYGHGIASEVSSSFTATRMGDAKGLIDKYINTHGAASSGALNLEALAEHGGTGSVDINGHGYDLGQALSTGALAKSIEAGDAQYVYGSGKNKGKATSLSAWAASKAGQNAPASNTKTNDASKGTAGTFGLTPQAAQLVQLMSSGSTQIGNNMDTLNTPPVGIPAYNS